VGYAVRGEIDWKLAEYIVATKSDPVALEIARATLAIRDGNRKPLK
jgi:hypothetical protein